MARLPELDEKTALASREVVETIKARRGGTLTALDRILLYSDPVARGWNGLFAAFYKDSVLDPMIRELAILKVVTIGGVELEMRAHRAAALKAGASNEQVDAIDQWAAARCFSERERAVLSYSETMTRQVQVPRPRYEAVRKHFDERSMVELTFIIATYNMVGRLIEALEIRPI